MGSVISPRSNPFGPAWIPPPPFPLPSHTFTNTTSVGSASRNSVMTRRGWKDGQEKSKIKGVEMDVRFITSNAESAPVRSKHSSQPTWRTLKITNSFFFLIWKGDLKKIIEGKLKRLARFFFNSGIQNPDPRKLPPPLASFGCCHHLGPCTQTSIRAVRDCDVIHALGKKKAK
ncbi:hypothetical protein IF1G_10087 [Cordyceps javanica]|uniref:Uncharacterized protein n=1 Tax=Cordyceps javanica TaxID=43265 RepID=A0A545UP10_9HYPO|nr:hypothetical protein IF1G_10087 [Cordyceps javanica]